MLVTWNEEGFNTEYLTRRWQGNGLWQLGPRPRRADLPCGWYIDGDWNIWFVSFTSAHNDLGVSLAIDFRERSSDFWFSFAFLSWVDILSKCDPWILRTCLVLLWAHGTKPQWHCCLGVAEPYMEAECTFCFIEGSLNSREQQLKAFQRAT